MNSFNKLILLIILICLFSIGFSQENNILEKSKYVIVSIDVEANPKYAISDPFDNLILGHISDSIPQSGIYEMIKIANKYKIKLVCFVDLWGVEMYGIERYKNLLKYIQQEGHEIQFHIHLDYIPLSWFEKHNMDVQRDLSKLDSIQSKIIMNYYLKLIDTLQIKKAPIAFRGGGYRISKDLYKILPNYGIKFISNYNNVKQGNLSFQIKPIVPDSCQDCIIDMPPFTWENGLIELPIGSIIKNNSHIQFSENLLGKDKVEDNLKIYFNRFNGKSNLLVFLMHSVSFFDYNSIIKKYNIPSNLKVENFENFCKIINSNNNYKSIGIFDLEDLIASGVIYVYPGFLELNNNYPQFENKSK